MSVSWPDSSGKALISKVMVFVGGASKEVIKVKCGQGPLIRVSVLIRRGRETRVPHPFHM